MTFDRRDALMRWHDTVCAVEAITFHPESDMVALHLLKHHCTDMGGAIRLSKRVATFPVRIVATFAEGRTDTVYIRVDGTDYDDTTTCRIGKERWSSRHVPGVNGKPFIDFDAIVKGLRR